MALETLKDIDKVNGHNIFRYDDNYDIMNNNEMQTHNIIIKEDGNLITFRIQDGPVQENGLNSCQVDEIIAIARIMIDGLNKNNPCRENSIVITKLDEARLWLNSRKLDREKRGVEGTSKN